MQEELPQGWLCYRCCLFQGQKNLALNLEMPELLSHQMILILIHIPADLLIAQYFTSMATLTHTCPHTANADCVSST